MEQSDTLTSVSLQDKQDASNEFEYTAVENTPFTIVKQGELYYGLLSNHRLTESYLNKEACEKELTAITWDRIVQVIWTISEKMKNINNINVNEDE